MPLLPYLAATQQPPSPIVVLVLAVAGFFTPDLILRAEVKRRREAIFLDLPEASPHRDLPTDRSMPPVAGRLVLRVTISRWTSVSFERSVIGS